MRDVIDVRVRAEHMRGRQPLALDDRQQRLERGAGVDEDRHSPGLVTEHEGVREPVVFHRPLEDHRHRLRGGSRLRDTPRVTRGVIAILVALAVAGPADAAVRVVAPFPPERYAETGAIGLAGPQVGRGVRIFTHALAELAPPVLINPQIVESRGEWSYQEGCLSIPGLYFDIVRPKEVHVRALDLQGNEVDFDADELLARVVQHEIDHLDGVLFVDLLEGEDRRAAELELRNRVAGSLGAADPFLTGKPVKALLRRRRPSRPLM